MIYWLYARFSSSGVKIISKSSIASSSANINPMTSLTSTPTPRPSSEHLSNVVVVTSASARPTPSSSAGATRTRLLGAGGKPVQITTVRTAGGSHVAPARVVSGKPNVIVVQKGRKVLTSGQPIAAGQPMLDADGKATILMRSGFEKVKIIHRT